MKKQFGDNEKIPVGIALSGGSARGFAHLGVLKALEEAGLHPGVISGVSAGAIVGAFYADGYSPEEILEMFIEKKLFQILHLNVNRTGFLKPSGIDSLIKKYLRAKTFDQLKIPLYITASDLNRGVAVYFHEGALPDKIMASSAIPVLFQPVVIEGTTYVDGGLIDNLPVQPVRNKCRVLVGVSANPNYEENDLNGFWKLTERTIYLNLVTRIQEHKLYCDIFIEPPTLKDYGLFEISKAREIFACGYDEAKRVLNKHAELLKGKT
ncbi:MAG TPA: patatin [Bacteroidetes bacterium]|nr:patatin [Bacteroidota bacterium]